MYNPPNRPYIEWDPRVEYALRKLGMSAREVEAMLREDPLLVTIENPGQDSVACKSGGMLRSGIRVCVVYDQYPSGAIRISDAYPIDEETLEQMRKLQG
jgi:hypothetical protein